MTEPPLEKMICGKRQSSTRALVREADVHVGGAARLLLGVDGGLQVRQVATLARYRRRSTSVPGCHQWARSSASTTWAGYCSEEALGEADEAVDPDWDCVPCGGAVRATPRTRADRESRQECRVLIGGPIRSATPLTPPRRERPGKPRTELPAHSTRPRPLYRVTGSISHGATSIQPAATTRSLRDGSPTQTTPKSGRPI